jgi:hypothetical protein
MKFKKVIWGILLIFFGTIILLSNMHVLTISWNKALNLWPLLIVLWGVSILPLKDPIKTILALLTLGLGVYLLFQGGLN